MTRSIWRWLEFVDNVKVGSDHVFVVLGVQVSGLTPIKACHFNANFAWASKMFILVQSGIFLDVHVEIVFVLTSTVQFKHFDTLWTFKNIFAHTYIYIYIYVGRSVGQCTYSMCKVASMLWYAHYGMIIDGCAQRLSWSHLVDYASIPLILQVKNWLLRYLIQEIKHDIFLWITSINYYNVAIKTSIMIGFHLEIARRSMFQDSTDNGHFTHEPRAVTL